MLKKRGNSGFTLLELMIAVVIVAIGAAVSYFSINGMMPGMRLSEASRNLKSDLNLAKLRAVRENATISIDFDTDEDSYTIYFDVDGDGSFSAGDTVVKTVTLEKVDLTAAAFGTGPVAQIFFDSRGLAMDSAGSASIANTKGKQHNVLLTQTGKVTIKKQ